MGKKKLLVLIDWFYPGYKAGGPIQSCINLCKALHTLYDIYVLTTDTDHSETVPYNNIETGKWLYNEPLGVQVYYIKKQAFTIKELETQIQWVNADIVYLNHLFSPRFVVYPLWLVYRGRIKSKVVVCPRGALYQSALSIKAYKKKPLLLLYKWLSIHTRVTFHATNEREEEAILHYFPGSRVVVADNLPAMQQQPFESIEKKAGSIKCIFIARIVPIKNLLFLLKVLNEVQQQVWLTVVGPIEDEAYWKQCREIIAALPTNIVVDYIGAKQNELLAELIRKHHLFVLPTTGENFGHSIFEALLAGRPVLISDQTPWRHLQQKMAGWDVALESDNFKERINLVARFNQQEFDDTAKGAWDFARNFIETSKAKQQYIHLFS